MPVRRHVELEAPDDTVTGHRVKIIVVCMRPELELHAVIEVMKRNRVIVCDQQRRLLGMVTRSKLVRIFTEHTTQPRQA